MQTQKTLVEYKTNFQFFTKNISDKTEDRKQI